MDGFDGTWQAEGDDIVVTIAFDYTHEAVITTTNRIHDGPFPAFSPGLVLTIISHDPPNVTCICENVAFIWLFAGESEQHMRVAEILSFVGATALVSVTVSTAVTGNSTPGASGGALAFRGVYGSNRSRASRRTGAGYERRRAAGLGYAVGQSAKSASPVRSVGFD